MFVYVSTLSQRIIPNVKGKFLFGIVYTWKQTPWMTSTCSILNRQNLRKSLRVRIFCMVKMRTKRYGFDSRIYFDLPPATCKRIPMTLLLSIESSESSYKNISIVSKRDYPFLLRSVRIVSQIYFAAKSDPPLDHERHIIFIGMAVTDEKYPQWLFLFHC